MSSSEAVLASAQAQFPKGANKVVRLKAAFRPSDRVVKDDQTNGWDGWTSINKIASRQVVEDLRLQGFTIANLETGGVANPFRDVPLSTLT
ncbi:hypothetical protein E3T55_16080 [Cryobacterium frigoriphilum]|uniref:Uncharacterized protein n=1 Tax=Cryobacterium frigoriphilum TaxID=1259150 RepID=A0A4R8ZUR7_9MICO|nr:hypothetical protein [Cryobacterium frigoriphilum]TFD46894.1 hypothetical protein E3T55_16080 [Cryobacterium frigoriphilum]